MTNKDLINLLLDFPMDMYVAIGLPRDDDKGMDIFAVNTADILELDINNEGLEEEPFIVLFHEEVIDPTLN